MEMCLKVYLMCCTRWQLVLRPEQYFVCPIHVSNIQSQWPHGLRLRSAADRLLRLWVRILPEA